MLKIRLRRMGSRHRPFYRVVVSDSRRVPTASALEEVGYYDPRKTPATLSLDVDRVDHWMSHGAQPSNTVRKLVAQARSMPAEAPPAEEKTDAKAKEAEVKEETKAEEVEEEETEAKAEETEAKAEETEAKAEETEEVEEAKAEETEAKAEGGDGDAEKTEAESK